MERRGAAHGDERRHVRDAKRRRSADPNRHRPAATSTSSRVCSHSVAIVGAPASSCARGGGHRGYREVPLGSVHTRVADTLPCTRQRRTSSNALPRHTTCSRQGVREPGRARVCRGRLHVVERRAAGRALRTMNHRPSQLPPATSALSAAVVGQDKRRLLRSSTPPSSPRSRKQPCVRARRYRTDVRRDHEFGPVRGCVSAASSGLVGTSNPPSEHAS